MRLWSRPRRASMRRVPRAIQEQSTESGAVEPPRLHIGGKSGACYSLGCA